ncbi:MAG: hypothetical protein WC613_05000 [Candidatus Aenigmatarchaeota archaeon]
MRGKNLLLPVLIGVVIFIAGCTSQNQNQEDLKLPLKISEVRLVETDSKAMSMNFYGDEGHFTDGKYWALLVTITNSNTTKYEDLNIESETDKYVSRLWFSSEFQGTFETISYLGRYSPINEKNTIKTLSSVGNLQEKPCNKTFTIELYNQTFGAGIKRPSQIVDSTTFTVVC